MKLQIAHIGDLSNMYFNIPDYQRGYRWETKQVCELLDDLFEFSESNKNNMENSGAFYCLQPLVVVENKDNLIPNEKVFDVIDGQQRLTTMFLILGYLQNGDVPYHLRYDRACDKNQSKSFSNGEITYKDLTQLKDDEIEKNPDFFYLTKAIDDIKDWFSQKKISYPKITGKISKVIIDDDYQKTKTPFYDDTNDNDINGTQRDVRFIWYDATNEEIDYKGSISVFKRLNYGKTSLTAAELIKALLFQCDVYESAHKAERRQVAFRMSTEWDRMEKSLQDKFMWSMLAPERKDKMSHIDFVLSYVAKQILEKNNLEINSSTDDDDYDYIIFNKYITTQNEKGIKYADIVDELWHEIQDVFDILTNWYNDRELYHLIGLRLTLLNPKNKKRTQKERNQYHDVLREMFNDYSSQSRSEFLEVQRKKIGQIIDLNKYNQNLQVDEMPTTLETLSYGKNDADLINILLVYNVTLCLNNSQDNQYFPFWFYRNITPSLEHIHPQHLHDDEITFDTRCQWYKEKCFELDHMDLKDKASDIQEAREILDKVLLLDAEEEKRDNDMAKKSFKQKEKDYETNTNTYRPELEKIDKWFDELASINEKELHSIRNMALVDKDTNAALGNGLMDAKRQRLMERQALFNGTEGKEGAYTFTGTWNVFNKQFKSDTTNEQRELNASNLLFWSKTDRNNYFRDLKNIYNQYVK